MLKLNRISTAVLVLATSVYAGAARADGFICQTTDRSLNVKIYNHMENGHPVPSSAVMVLSNPRVQNPRKTIAVLREVKTVQVGDDSRYEAKVDLRHKGSKRRGENVAGTKLGELSYIDVQLESATQNPIEDDEMTVGALDLVKRNGEILKRDIECARYVDPTE